MMLILNMFVVIVIVFIQYDMAYIYFVVFRVFKTLKQLSMCTIFYSLIETHPNFNQLHLHYLK